jgi:hypothetical protein
MHCVCHSSHPDLNLIFFMSEHVVDLVLSCSMNRSTEKQDLKLHLDLMYTFRPDVKISY